MCWQLTRDSLRTQGFLRKERPVDHTELQMPEAETEQVLQCLTSEKGRCQLEMPHTDSRLFRDRMEHTPVQCHRGGATAHLLWDTHSVWLGRLQ